MRILLLSLLLACTGCSAPEGPTHYERAIAIERELVRTVDDLSYSDPGYVQVLRELKQVPSSSPDRARALALSQRISDGRRVALNAAMPQVDHLPRRLVSATPPTPPSRKAAPARKKRPAATTAARDRLALTDVQRGKLDITLYSTTWCGYCKKARRWFESADVPFVEKDIEKDPAAHAEYQKAGRGYRGVPLIVVNGTPLRGFSRPSVEKVIRQVVGS